MIVLTVCTGGDSCFKLIALERRTTTLSLSLSGSDSAKEGAQGHFI